MRIAMLGHKKMPSRAGGVEVVVEELATRMAALGHEVTVYSRKMHNESEKSGASITMYKGVAIKEVPTLDMRGFAALTSSYYATKAAIADLPDVIHFHAEGPCAMIPLAKRAGIRTVATIHGLDWRRAKWGRIASSYIKHGEKTAANYADEIIVLSRGVQGYFEGAYGRKTVYIPNGVAKKTPRPADEINSLYGLSRGSYILYLGRMVPEKGVHYLIDAFRGVKTDKRLVIAGGSSDSDRYYSEIRNMAHDDPRIIFTDFVYGQVLEELYSNAYFYVLPSDLEGMPMSLLEAMAYGCCCLTSDISDCVGVIGDTGFTFSQGNILSLRGKLEMLLNNEAIVCESGKLARKRTDELFRWDSIVNATIALYEGNHL